MSRTNYNLYLEAKGMLFVEIKMQGRAEE